MCLSSPSCSRKRPIDFNNSFSPLENRVLPPRADAWQGPRDRILAILSVFCGCPVKLWAFNQDLLQSCFGVNMRHIGTVCWLNLVHCRATKQRNLSIHSYSLQEDDGFWSFIFKFSSWSTLLSSMTHTNISATNFQSLLFLPNWNSILINHEFFPLCSLSALSKYLSTFCFYDSYHVRDVTRGMVQH